MVTGLASARKQLQSRLIYLCRQNFPYCSARSYWLALRVLSMANFCWAKRGTPKPAAPKSAAPKPMRKASELISRQDPVKINNSLLKQITPDSVHVAISLPRQRAYLMMGDQIVIDSPISSGKRGHSTPTGHFSIMEKDADHRSNIYGDFVDSSGRVVRAGISAKSIPPPAEHIMWARR